MQIYYASVCVLNRPIFSSYHWMDRSELLCYVLHSEKAQDAARRDGARIQR